MSRGAEQLETESRDLARVAVSILGRDPAHHHVHGSDRLHLRTMDSGGGKTVRENVELAYVP